MAARTSSLAGDLRSLHVALRQLDRSLTRIVRRLGTATPAASPGAPRPRRKLNLSPARKAALKLQGQYVGHMRGLSQANKAKVRKVRTAKGVRAAIALAKRLSH